MDTGCIPAWFEVVENPVTYYILKPDRNDVLVYSDCVIAFDPFKKNLLHVLLFKRYS